MTNPRMNRKIITSRSGETDIAIDVFHLTKQFLIPQERKRSIFEHVKGLLKGGSYRYEIFSALDDVSFTVKKGESFGVIGPNGSGKSTLLKVLAGVLYADSGTVEINGLVSPFLELGVGFTPDLTAKENVYLYGAIMGIPTRELDQRYEEIFKFAELKRFENMKLRHFSSGMILRLAFSTAVQTDPEVMLVDEGLAVGDASFKKKSWEKIDELQKKGTTILLVSHDLEVISRLCSKCLLLQKGKVVMTGKTAEVIEMYNKIIERGEMVENMKRKKLNIVTLTDK